MLSLLLIALQGTPDPAPPTPAQEAPASSETTAADDVRLWTGGVQAPTQPTGRSSSTVRETERFAPIVQPRDTSRLRTPVGSLVAVRGQESNHVMGIGLVTGLAGTGDTGDSAKQLLQNLLLTRNINLDLQTLESKNVAIVRVEAEIQAGLKPGRRIDVRVSTIGDAKSLAGGTLTLTELTDVTGTVVYGTASGPLTIGGFQAEGDGATATRNHVTVGTLPSGGKVEREIATRIVSEHGYVYLDSRVGHDTFGNVVGITDSINQLYPGAAQAMPDGKTVRVQVPVDVPEALHVAFLASILKREIVSEDLARVVVNERSGVVVMGGDVRLRPGAIAYGNLTVTIAETPEASQPGAFSDGTTAELARTALDVEEDNNGLVLVPGAVTLQEVVEVLNVLGTSPRDLISILQAMSQAGLLVAEIHRM